MDEKKEQVKKAKGKERINPLNSTEEGRSISDDMPVLLDEEEFIKKALQAYYQSQSTFRQGLSERQESITQSFINLSIIPRDVQQQKEQALVKEDESEEERAQKPVQEEQIQERAQDECTSQHETKEPSIRDERLASYEALRTNPEPIALEDLFKQEISSSQAKQRLLVLGRAGIGKTTLSQHIAYRWAINELWPQFTYVFWLPLRNLNQSHYQTISDITLAILIKQECVKTTQEAVVSIDDIAALLEQAKAKTLLILDGYDEVAHLIDDSDNPLSQVLQQALAFPNLLVTSRPYAVPDNKLFDRSLEVMGFTHDNILTYVKNYFNHAEVKLSQEVEPLQNFLKTNPNIWGTAHVPINLALICNAWEEASHQGESLNVRLTMTGLYRNLVQALLKRALTRQGKLIYEASPKWLEQQNKRATKLLAALAALGLAQQQIILSASLQQQAFTLLKLDKEEARLALSESVALGLLQPIGSNQTLATSYYFIHLTFQEFFAARYYEHSLHKASHTKAHQEALTFIREHKYNSYYQLVFWFMAGLVSASEKQRPLILFWQTLLAKPHDVLGFAQLRLLIHCLDEAQLDKRIPQKNNLVCFLSQAVDAAVFGKKVGVFAWFRGVGEDDSEVSALEESLSQFLLTELSHTSFLTQEPLFYKQLIACIKQNKDTKMIIRAIEALDKLNLTVKAVDIICEQEAMKDNDYAVRQAAFRALRNLNHPPSALINLFVERAVLDEVYGRGAEEAAIKALGRLAHSYPVVIALLWERVGQAEDYDTRAGTIRILGKLINSSPVVIALFWERVKQAEDCGIREDAIKVLKELAYFSPAVTNFLCEQVEQNILDPNFQTTSIESILPCH